jgi:hypothetical protein
MSNSVVFLLIAVGLSLLGTLAVWLHGRPRRRSSVDVFSRSLRALSTNESHHEPLSGVTVRPITADADTDADLELDTDRSSPEPEPESRARTSRPSPRPSPRPAAPRGQRAPRARGEGADPGT